MTTIGEHALPHPGAAHSQRLLAAALAAVLATISPAFAQPPAPAPQATAAPVLSPALDRKIREARASGTWLVEEGEHLYAISRYLSADEPDAQRLAREIQAANPDAVAAGDGGRLVVGARLRLPPRVTREPTTTNMPSTLPERVEAGTPRRDAPLVSGPPVYVDQLIGGEQAEEEERREDAEPRDTSPGVRATAIELRLDRRTQTFGGLALAQGAAMRHRAETERFGDFTLEAELGRERGLRPPPAQGQRLVGRATLHHDQFALTGDLVASSAFGAIRMSPSPWLASSYRVHLPSTLAAGAGTVVDGPGLQVRAAYGRLSRLSGLAIQDIDLVPGTLAMVEATAQVANGWRVGATAASLRGAASTPDHGAVTFAAEYVAPRALGRVKVQALVDDRGRAGAWSDAEYRWGRLVQRFGGFQVEPDTLFGDGSLPRDSRGVYWRGELRRPDISTTFGAEATENNLRRDDRLGGAAAIGAFGNVTLRLDRSTNVGAGLSLREESPRTARGTRRTVHLANAFGSRQFSWGLTRADLAINASRPAGLPSETITTITLAHDWPRFADIHANTLVSYSEERFAERVVRRSTASVGLRGVAFDAVNWSLAYTFVDVDDPLLPQRNYNAALGLDWAAARHWVVRLQWLRNQVEPTRPDPFVPFVRENAVQISARYEESEGTPYPRVAGRSGRSGTGWVEGFVFFDENGDGVRQAIERGAPGVVVILDGRSTQVTDRDGRFSFGLVGSGEHRLTISLDKVPLPWGLQDESPRAVRVEVREGARADIPLTRITP